MHTVSCVACVQHLLACSKCNTTTDWAVALAELLLRDTDPVKRRVEKLIWL